MSTETSNRVAWSIPEWGARYNLSRAAAYKLIKNGHGPRTVFIPGTTKQVITAEADAAYRVRLNGCAA